MTDHKYEDVSVRTGSGARSVRAATELVIEKSSVGDDIYIALDRGALSGQFAHTTISHEAFVEAVENFLGGVFIEGELPEVEEVDKSSYLGCLRAEVGSTTFYETDLDGDDESYNPLAIVAAKRAFAKYRAGSPAVALAEESGIDLASAEKVIAAGYTKVAA